VSAFDPGEPITSGDLIEDSDGAPLPHELQPHGAIWNAVNDGLLNAVSVAEAEVETAALMRALAPVLWPLLPSNDSSREQDTWAQPSSFAVDDEQAEQQRSEA
jgi:hypothetical protein